MKGLRMRVTRVESEKMKGKEEEIGEEEEQRFQHEIHSE